MEFLHPWAIWLGAAAAALPVLVHLWTRPRPVRLPLSTIRFVREVIRLRSARRRLRDFIILALRTAAVLWFALAIARPVPPGRQSESLDAGRDASTLRVVVLDVSQSMAATEAGVSSIQRAKAAAVRWLKFRPGLKVNLLLAAARCEPVFAQTSTNFEALRDAVAGVQIAPERLDVHKALDSASQMLAPASKDDPRRFELVIVSDFQRNNWSNADFSLLPESVEIRLESVAPPRAPANLALLQVQCRLAPDSSEGQLAVELANYTGSTRLVRLEAEVGGRIYRLEGTCPASGHTVLEHTIRAEQTGWTIGEVRLADSDDALSADDRRPVAGYRRPPACFALLTREPPEMRPSSSHFLRCALAPQEDPRGQGARRVQIVDSAVEDARALTAADVVVIDRPGRLPQETLSLLAQLLRRGRPLMYAVSEASDAANLGRLAQAVGVDWQLPVEFSSTSLERARRPLRLARVERRFGPLEVFGDHLPALVAPLRFFTGLGSRRVERGVPEDILAEYDDSTASLVLTRSGAGSLAVINADLAASTLAKSAAFAPLIHELVAAMLREDARSRSFCGEPLVARAPGQWTAEELVLLGPDGGVESGAGGLEGRFGRLHEESAGIVWRWPKPSPPGVYRIRHGEEDVLAQAVEIPPEESDLTPLAADVLTQRLAAGRRVQYVSLAGSSQTSDDRWTWLLVACVACFMGEVVALLAFRDS